MREPDKGIPVKKYTFLILCKAAHRDGFLFYYRRIKTIFKVMLHE